MRVVCAITVIVLLMLASFMFIGITTGEENPTVYGHVRDIRGSLIDGVYVELRNLNNFESVFTTSYDNGYYIFNLNELEHGWSDGDRFRVTFSYLDADGQYYHDSVFFNVSTGQLSYEYDLDAGGSGFLPVIERYLPAVVAQNSICTVEISGRSFGQAALIWETIPDGFVFTGCTLWENNQYEYFPENNTVMFILFDQSYFSYNLTTPLDLGEYTFSGYFLDFYKNEHEVTGNNTLRVDSFPIIINHSIAGFEGINASNVTFTPYVVNGTPPFSYQWDIDNDGHTDYSTETISHIFTEEGEYLLRLIVTDADDVVMMNTTKITITMDLEAIYNGPFTVERGESVWFNASSKGGVSPVEYKWDSDNDSVFEIIGRKFIYAFMETGNYAISFMVTDSGSPSETDTYTFVVTCIDTKLLSPDISLSDGVVITSRNQDVQIEYPEAVYIKTAQLDGTQVTVEIVNPKLFNVSLTGLSQTTHSLNIKAEDKVGHEGWVNTSFTVDLTNPYVTINTTKDVAKREDIQITAGDEHTSIASIVFELISDNKIVFNYTSNVYPCELPFDPKDFTEGTYTLSVTVYDEAGHKKTVLSTFNIVKSEPFDYLWIIILVVVIIVILAIIFVILRRRK